MPFTGTGTGIGNADDVFFSSVSDNDTLSYNSATAKWNNAQPSGGAGDTSQIAATVVYGAGAVPARPAGYARVVWVGAADPAANAEEFDVWEQTA